MFLASSNLSGFRRWMALTSATGITSGIIRWATTRNTILLRCFYGWVIRHISCFTSKCFTCWCFSKLAYAHIMPLVWHRFSSSRQWKSSVLHTASTCTNVCMQDRMFYSYKHLGGQLSNRMPHEEKKGREPTKHQQKWVFLVTYTPFYGGARAKGRQLIQRLVSIYKILRQSGPAEKNRGCTHRLPIPVAAFGPSNPEILTGIQGQVWGPDCFELLDAAPAYVFPEGVS